MERNDKDNVDDGSPDSVRALQDSPDRLSLQEIITLDSSSNECNSDSPTSLKDVSSSESSSSTLFVPQLVRGRKCVKKREETRTKKSAIPKKKRREDEASASFERIRNTRLPAAHEVSPTFSARREQILNSDAEVRTRPAGISENENNRPSASSNRECHRTSSTINQKNHRSSSKNNQENCPPLPYDARENDGNGRASTSGSRVNVELQSNVNNNIQKIVENFFTPYNNRTLPEETRRHHEPQYNEKNHRASWNNNQENHPPLSNDARENSSLPSRSNDGNGRASISGSRVNVRQLSNVDESLRETIEDFITAYENKTLPEVTRRSHVPQVFTVQQNRIIIGAVMKAGPSAKLKGPCFWRPYLRYFPTVTDPLRLFRRAGELSRVKNEMELFFALFNYDRGALQGRPDREIRQRNETLFTLIQRYLNYYVAQKNEATRHTSLYAEDSEEITAFFRENNARFEPGNE